MLRTARGKRFGADSFWKNSQLRAHGSQLGKTFAGEAPCAAVFGASRGGGGYLETGLALRPG